MIQFVRSGARLLLASFLFLSIMPQGSAQSLEGQWRLMDSSAVSEITDVDQIAQFMALHPEKFASEQAEILAQTMAGLPRDPVVSIQITRLTYHWTGRSRCQANDPKLTVTV